MSKTIEALEQEMKSLKERVKFLEGIVLEGKPYTPGQDEWFRACEAAADGDVGPLERFLKMGGQAPDTETINMWLGHRPRPTRGVIPKPR